MLPRLSLCYDRGKILILHSNNKSIQIRDTSSVLSLITIDHCIPMESKTITNKYVRALSKYMTDWKEKRNVVRDIKLMKLIQAKVFKILWNICEIIINSQFEINHERTAFVVVETMNLKKGGEMNSLLIEQYIVLPEIVVPQLFTGLRSRRTVNAVQLIH